MFPERSEKSGMDFQNCFPGNYGYRKIHFAEKSFRLNKTCPNQKFAETEACFFLNLITNQKYLNDGFERMFLGSLLKKSNSEGSFQITLYHDTPAMHTHSKSQEWRLREKQNRILQIKIKEYFGLFNKKSPKYPYSIKWWW